MIQKGIDIKLNVRPIYIALVHKYYYEGPCRFNPTENCNPEFEEMMEAQTAEFVYEDIKAHLENEPGVNLMDMITVYRDDELLSKESYFEEMMVDAENVDLFIIGTQMARADIAVQLAERTHKPIMVQPQNCCMHARIVSMARSHGQEAYAFNYWEDAIVQIKALRLRKVMQNTNVLSIVRWEPDSPATGNAFYNTKDVTGILGTKFRNMNLHELLDQFSPTDPSENHTIPGRVGINPTEEDMKEIEKITDELYGGADFADLEKDKVMNSVRMWYTVQKALDKYDCNAFTAPCPDFCSTRRALMEQVTFCLTHSLNTEIGIPSSCEGDLPTALSIQLLMNASGCATFMGECSPMVYENGKAKLPYTPLNPEEVTPIEDVQNMAFIFHSVGNRKMRGLNEPAAEKYGLTPFAYAGFGATLRYDFSLDVGQPITLCHLSPDCKKLLIVKGTVVAGNSYKSKNCSLAVMFQVNDLMDFYNKQLDFAQHMPITYGDCADVLKKFAESAGLEVVEA